MLIDGVSTRCGVLSKKLGAVLTTGGACLNYHSVATGMRGLANRPAFFIMSSVQVRPTVADWCADALESPTTNSWQRD
jgi:hypothetical protein